MKISLTATGVSALLYISLATALPAEKVQDSQFRKKLELLAFQNECKITLGPKGRNVVLDKSFGCPAMTRDGITIAKEIDLEAQKSIPATIANIQGIVSKGVKSMSKQDQKALQDCLQK